MHYEYIVTWRQLAYNFSLCISSLSSGHQQQSPIFIQEKSPFDKKVPYAN